jgi:hypothetical protein
MMITRLTVGRVPIWQPIVAAGLKLFVVVLIIRAVEILLSGQPFPITGYLNALVNSQEGVIMDLIIHDNDNMV